MKRLAADLRTFLPREIAESARDCVARGQAALLDDHVSGAQRQLLCLYDLLIPRLDAWIKKEMQDRGEQGIPVSAAVGLLGLWEELLDIDVEHESIEERVVFFAAQADPSALPVELATKEELRQILAQAPRPRSRFLRRLCRRAQGSFGDRAHITVSRGKEIVLERPPQMNGAPPAWEAGALFEWTTNLGALYKGDRLTLRWPMPLPGQVAVLHAVGDGYDAELSLLLPQNPSEAVVRRQDEVVEVVGELSDVDGAPEHAIFLLWVPELLPPTWPVEVLARRRVPQEARLYFYRYTVNAAAS